jgi:hypothetical protein
MVGTIQWMRNRIACYGAAITIILEQINATPRSTVTENPNPLVRIREQAVSDSEWHPDELITQRSGQQCVLVWSGGMTSRPGERVLRN